MKKKKKNKNKKNKKNKNKKNKKKKIVFKASFETPVTEYAALPRGQPCKNTS
jgi:hypothetical protein